MKTRTGRVRRTVAVVTVAGALSVGVSALSAGAAAADSSPEIQYPDAATCLFLFNTDGYAVTVVDGSSTDQTVPLARAFADRLPGLHVCVSAKASAPYQRNLGAGATSSPIAMTTAGTFKYHCTIHPGMIGTLVVQ